MKKEIRTSIEINAPAEKVWEILTDFENFSSWNPFVTKAKGVPKAGEKIHIEVQIPGASLQKFKPEILKANENRELRWVGTAPVKTFRGEHFFIVEPIGKDKCRFIHGELFSGWLVRLIWFLQGGKIERGYELMNKALKEKAEREK